MAELTTSSGTAYGRKAVVRKSKKLSPRVDLTPMVDLGFLLITFFIFTTTLSSPTALKLTMPAEGPPSNIGNSAALSILAAGHDSVFYYHGNLPEALQSGEYGITDIASVGEIIRRKQAVMDRSFKGGRNELFLLIKPSAASRYKNLVGLLDETIINKIGHYAVTDLNAAEKALLDEKKL